jgi:hypothetical protein
MALTTQGTKHANQVMQIVLTEARQLCVIIVTVRLFSKPRPPVTPWFWFALGGA